MIRKAFIILAVVSAARILAACCHCVQDSFRGHFTHTTVESLNLDNSGQIAVVSMDTINKNSYGIRLIFDLKKTAFRKALDFGFTGAYAGDLCSCAPDSIYAAAESPSTIGIIANDALTAAFPAGSEVTSLFKVYSGGFISDGISGGTYTSIPDYLAQRPAEMTYWQGTQTVDFFLLTTPLAGSHSFTIITTFSDGRTSAVTPEMVYLK